MIVKMFEDEAIHYAKNCWNNIDVEFDQELAEAIAKQIKFWMDFAAQNLRNVEYYRGLLDQIGESIGPAAYIADDGSISDSVLVAKLPEMIKNICKDSIVY
jgi:hypothetical protein